MFFGIIEKWNKTWKIIQNILQGKIKINFLINQKFFPQSFFSPFFSFVNVLFIYIFLPFIKATEINFYEKILTRSLYLAKKKYEGCFLKRNGIYFEEKKSLIKPKSYLLFMDYFQLQIFSGHQIWFIIQEHWMLMFIIYLPGWSHEVSS